MNIPVFKTLSELREQLEHDRANGKRIGFVPTMGALHAGHISLIQYALAENDKVVCSIFVNPTQFNDPADLKKYPRMPDKDIRMLEDAGCSYVFLPSVEVMYPEGEKSVDFHLGRITESMEGAFRPGHFNGVATVVDRLFNYVQPDSAYFGEKDFQQLAVIRRMTELRKHRTKIVGCPTLREADGLAMSSRNMLLTAEQRKAAPLIFQGLQKGQEFIPYHSVEALKHMIIRYIEQSPLLKVQYLEFVNPLTLEPVTEWKDGEKVQACIAVLTEGPRLIDNIQYKVGDF